MDPLSPECTFTTEYTWCVPTYVVILPKITGGISAICSAYLAKLMISEKKQTPYHRLLLNMSIADIISSTFVHVIGSWMMPRGTAPLSSGNLITCDVQGFFGQILLITMPYLNASLTTYYNLIIRYNWTDGQIAKVEKSLHLIPWALGIVLSVVVLVAKQLVPGTWGCWFGNTQYPPDCDSAETCVRGWNSTYYFWPIFVVILLAPSYVMWSMYLVYSSIRRLEKRMATYASASPDERRNRRNSRKVMEQSILFSSALLLTLLFAEVEILISEFGKPIAIWIHVVLALTFPLQGFYNLLIHLRRGGNSKWKNRGLSKRLSKLLRRDGRDRERDASPQQITAATTPATATCQITEKVSTMSVEKVEVKDPQEETNDNEHTDSFDENPRV
eukprot:CAMPEP_0201692366 /NCGR_PEP_ID=MMETSP0578-20130828/5278_1 /ASSEMBLY_ACC=CAM_ASM_000663 /TAXON_ID=267565 /ORGANISM="Skeletonema grethea, Strain CCMP 1804" /LENGTH=387 /DNA_ID=CAMNT_0048177727 /DNA_START=314 /DNA_END=1477 /DNA_ORIENTATION=+